jgi:glyoxylase-like metal-dependent hydrolase (beta-lactamase superfamily II)
MDSEAEIAPGIRILPAPGHRPGHVAVEIASQGERLWHLADTITHPLFVEHPEWGTGFDSAPDEALATRRRFLALAATEGPLVFLSHFPFPGLGRVAKSLDTYRWSPIEFGARR